MIMTKVKVGLVLAGLVNIIGVLLFSNVFGNEVLKNADPYVMSNFGLVMIIVWGLSYIAAAMDLGLIKYLALVFALEKLAYVINWVLWHIGNNVITVWEQDLLAGVFYLIYGINDFIFMVFFVYVFIFSIRKRI